MAISNALTEVLQDRVKAIGLTLGHSLDDTLDIINRFGYDKADEYFKAERSSLEREYGAWYTDILGIKAYIRLVEMYEGSPMKQRIAYTMFVSHVRGKVHTDDFSKYEYIVHDPAFGKMVFTGKEETCV